MRRHHQVYKSARYVASSVYHVHHASVCVNVVIGVLVVLCELHVTRVVSLIVDALVGLTHGLIAHVVVVVFVVAILQRIFCIWRYTSFGPPLLFPFPFLFNKRSWNFDCQTYELSSYFQKKTIFHHHRNLAQRLLRLCPIVHIRLRNSPSTMKILLVLPPCPFTRSEGLSIDLFGVQNNSRNTVFSASRV